MTVQAVGWALHALEPDEELALALHRPGCSSCQETIDRAERVLGVVASAAIPAIPPQSLRENLRAIVAATPQAHLPNQWVGPTRTTATVPLPQRVPPLDRPGPVRPRDRRRRALIAAVFAVVVLGAGGVTGYSTHEHQQRGTQLAQSQALADVVAQVIRPGTAKATLATSAGMPAAAVLGSAADRTVVTSGLPPNDRSNSTYVLWGISTADPQPLGAFDVEAGDAGVHALGAAAGPNFLGYAISLEPGRSAPARPGPVVASGLVST
ncbi:anti-sigma factor [Pseudonocardia sp. GCM10023141]|uniref:anti-sigma factor n=1 Tax=Pseudonocardia sp. GCM10023141 TaxID=3252653 RepID=UPI00361765BC